MKCRLLVFLVLVLLAALLPGTVLAGGWATITLETWPGEVVAGQPVEVSFIVRQHGRDDRRMNDLAPTVSIRSPQNGEETVFQAKQQGEPGRYAAELVFPGAGEWEWTVSAFSIEQPLPALTVLEATTQPAAPPFAVRGDLLSAGGLAMALLALAAVIGRKRRRWAIALAVVGLAVAGVGLAAAASGALASSVAQPRLAASAASPAELGQALFVAKGCVQCHVNRRVDPQLTVFSTEIGPDLTSYSASPEFLQMWLKDPGAVKPQTQMPDLGLSAAEIEALTVFLRASGD